MKKAIYKGFSTQSQLDSRGRSFAVINIECVKRDLLNHIYTIPGERVMHPDFGTRIPLMAFEPLDQISMDIIKADLTTVVNYDPRVNLISIVVLALPDNNTIVALLDIQYLELNITETLKLDFPVGG